MVIRKIGRQQRIERVIGFYCGPGLDLLVPRSFVEVDLCSFVGKVHFLRREK